MKHLPPSQEPDYWREPDIARSCAAKWRSGLQEHRGGLTARPFRGHPLVEAFAECIDQINYLDEAHRQGLLSDGRHVAMRTAAAGLAVTIQIELKIQEAAK